MENILKLSDDGKHLLKVLDTDVTEIVIPQGVECIPNGFFRVCDSLKCITIPDSVELIGENILSDIASLQEINVSHENPVYTSVDGVLFSKDLKKLIRFPNGKDIQEYDIPESVTSIEKGAFRCCVFLQRVYIPNSVTIIGDEAFSFSNLRYVDVPNSVKSIGVGTFSLCSSLQYVKIRNGVTDIGTDAFRYCRNLRIIDIPDSVSHIGLAVFGYCTSLQIIRLRHHDIWNCKIDGWIFMNMDFSSLSLHIPEGSRMSYENHPVFSVFKNIVEENQEDV